MDILGGDLELKTEFTSAMERAVQLDNDKEDAFHFSSYLPIHEVLWRLDGLQRYPQKLGHTLRRPDRILSDTCQEMYKGEIGSMWLAEYSSRTWPNKGRRTSNP